MNILSPSLAVELAEFAYKSLRNNKSGALDASMLINKNFAFSAKNSKLDGVSGTVAEHLLNHASGFGFFGLGKNEGQFAGDIVIAFRGTAGLADTLTDLHCGVTVGPNYKAVHAGFNRTFESIKPQLASLLNKAGNRAVHCVGHSLGGALATLAANWIKSQYKVPVKLYTFGAPRVGFNPFALQTETRLNGIYRAVHRSDPVPMVPVWPFVHAGNEYRLSTCVSFNASSHKMLGNAPGYIATASKYSDYKQMQLGSIQNLAIVRLKYQERHLASFNAHWADKIGDALLTLLRDSGKITSILTQAAVGSALTIYDALARGLVEISQMSSRYAEDTKGILGHILNYVGKPGVKIVDMTYQLIKDILVLMLNKLNTVVSAAIPAVSMYM
ncbi:lipase family protein [Shewanella sp. 1_MG-2023]|uniref:lipase family protein n=1 Tax=unclassified Shewanella TaxID=196818 RepID=UPI0026E13551|nr:MULTISPECIES: lipase family protein [unclassified Shewanella]MDO6610178.1 lipase family protein [Shewanella sp. 7_MG-2023]MDO6769680.1 lipase family protein [Shewanella sp. 2_MG-2023]MDO6792744.1 lipase family protein [Shewanella sp. 1_MG-2023]